jgi:hypothetical protein
MTRNYNRSEILSYYDLTDEQKQDTANVYYLTDEQAEQDNYVLITFKGKTEAVPLSFFERTEKNNFTHGIFTDTYYSGYFITLSRCNTEAVIAYKYF